MTGDKTKEQQLRMFERKSDVPKPHDPKTDHPENEHGQVDADREARQSEMPVSRHGMNQESRQHNKHNRPHKGADPK